MNIQRAGRTMLLMLTVGCLIGADRPSAMPSLTEAEKKDGWVLLFDGVSTKGWRGLGMEGFPRDCWVVEKGCLHCLGGPGRANDVITERKYDNFELALEWMVPKAPGNTGVKYRV